MTKSLNMKKIAFTLLSIAALAVSAQEIRLTPQNIDEVLSALTLEEKVNLIVGCHDAYTSKSETMIGHQERIVPDAAGTTTAVERLGVPPTVFTDGPAGVRISEWREGADRNFYATGFPIATALASSWDLDLVYETTAAMGNETLEYGCDVLLAPGTNIHRHPLCGRNFEYFSEDPILSGKMSAAYINGVQSQGVGTSIKHFVANNQETMRFVNDSRVDMRTLRELYLKPFEIALRESNPWTVMSSYDKLNGEYTQCSEWLLTKVLREEWGYDGIVVTDWTGTRNTIAQIKAGNDHLQPGTDDQVTHLMEGVQKGWITMDYIDRAARRVLEYIVKTPRYKGYQYSDNPDLTAHAALVRRVGSECMVLLKNDGDVLPLRETKNVALFGVTSYDMLAGGTGSGDVHKPYISQLSDALEAQGLTLNADIKWMYVNYKTYAQCARTARFGHGGDWQQPVLPEAAIDRTIIERAAKSSDVAIYTLGRQAGEGSDRKVEDDFNLTAQERQIIADICDAFHQQGKPVIVIMNTPSVVETASWKTQPDAILLAWEPGQEVGNSVADVLTGKVCPSGKLPCTFPNSCMDHLSSRNFPLFGGKERMPVQEWDPRSTMEYTNYEEGLLVGYRYFTTAQKAVSYPFGYGLSYTTFAYSGAKIKKVGDGFEVSVTIKNTGKVAGKEVAQLYANGVLKAFAKTRELKPGESETLTMNVPNYFLARYDVEREMWVTDKGEYTITLNSDVLTTQATLTYKVAKELTYTNDYNYTK